MAIVLDRETEDLIHWRLEEGRFESPGDLVRVALHSLDEEQWLVGIDGAALTRVFPSMREAIETGLAEAANGQLTDGEEFFADLEDK